MAERHSICRWSAAPALNMKIVIVCEYFYPDNSGGTPTDLSELARYLKDQHTDIEIDVITSKNLYRRAGLVKRLLPIEDWNGIRITRLGTPKSNRSSVFMRLLAGGLFSLLALCHLLLRRRYELVLIVTNPPANAFTAWAYQRLRRVPYVYFVNDLYPDIAVALGHLEAKSLSVRIFHYFQQCWLGSAARIVVVGRCMQRHISREYRVPLQRISIIRNWADPIEIKPSNKENEFRSVNGLKGFVVLYGGNFSHYVNFKQILSAAKLLRENRDITFVLIGDGLRRAEIINEIDKQLLTNVRVFPAVPRSAMSEVMAASDVSLISLNPRMLGLGTPGKIYSILASGRPIIGIVPHGSEVALILEEEQCGINVAEGDEKALARDILRLQGDVELTTRMGRNGRLALERRFTLQSAVKEFRSVFEQVLANE